MKFSSIKFVLLLALLASKFISTAQVGTYLVKDIVSGSQSSTPHYFMKAGGLLYFVAYSNTYSLGLYKTDGTDSGTELITESVQPFKPDPTILKNYVDYNGSLVFTSQNKTTGEGEVWVSDGSSAGTKKISDFAVGMKSRISNLTVFNNTLYFVVTSTNSLFGGLYKWTGTGLVTKLYDVGDAFGVAGNQLIVSPTKLLLLTTFKVYDITTDIPDLIYDYGDENSFYFFIGPSNYLNGKLILSEYYISFGAQMGGFRLLDLTDFTESTIPDSYGIGFHEFETVCEMNGAIYFIYGQNINVDHTSILLYKIDNSFTLSVVKEFDRNNAIVSNFLLSNSDRLLFTIETVDKPYNELWTSDGTDTGTIPLLSESDGVEVTHSISSIVVMDTVVFFQARSVKYEYPYTKEGTELWKSNFTKSGTKMAVDFFQGEGHGIGFSDLIQVNDSSIALCAYRANDTDGALYGRELWITDGTPFSEVTSTMENIKSDFSVYPNPSTDYITLPDVGKVESIACLSPEGTRVLFLTSMPESNTISLAHCKAGIFYLKITTPTCTYVGKVTKL